MPAGEQTTVLLDTHAWLWLVSGDRALSSSPALGAVEAAAAAGVLVVGAISVWEVCMLEEKGRIRLKMDRMEWVRRALSAPGLSLAPLSPEIAVESTRLPGEFHGDPADRMIVATARALGATLATRDKQILRYAADGFVNALAV